jgi:ankyrin repeat protein
LEALKGVEGSVFFMNRITNFLCLSLLFLGAMAFGMDASKEPLGEQLNIAAECGDLDEVQELIAQGASVNAKDYYGRTPLIWGALNGHEDICKLLIANKASVDAKDNDGLTPLYCAARYRHDVVCMLLLDVQLEEARKNKASVVTFLGIVRKRSYHLPCHMQYDVAKLIARQAFESVRQDKQPVIDAIKKSGDKVSIPLLLAHVKEQMNLPIEPICESGITLRCTIL